MLGSVDIGAVLAAVIPLAGAIVAGGLGMAWRLGGLERTVKDVQQDVADVKDDTRQLSSDVATLRGLVDRRQQRGGW